MVRFKRLVALCLAYYTCGVASAQNDTAHVSKELFDSLDELSRLVDIAYCVGTTGVQQPFECLSHCAEFPNLELVTTWNTGVFLSDSCGYIALSHAPGPKRIIVAFRGTYSITNTIIDLSAYPQSYVPYTGDEDDDNDNNNKNKDHTTNPLNQTTKCENCTVHAGFLTSWLNTRSTILPHIMQALQQHPEYEVTLVGHSLGGAVAALAGLEMRMKGWDPKVTTFGEPMVGNQQFVEFFDKQFQLGEQEHNSSTNNRGIPQRFYRVTHVDDPVPLLPLREWGYAPHAGEIYISKSDLPPAVEDVRRCHGDEDPRCIAQSETSTLVHGMLQDVNVPLNVLDNSLDPCPKHREIYGGQVGHQQVLSQERRDPKHSGSTDCVSSEATAPLYPRRWTWSLIPARYRLWELFHAHRDYFWRIGLCVPGGDPTG